MIAGLVRASHPAPSAAVTILVTVLAITAGHDVRGWLIIAAMVLAGQLSIGWANDAIDAERDRIAGRRDKPIATGEVSLRAVANAASVALALCVPLSLAAGLAAGLVHLVAVGAGWAYNLGVKSTVWSPLPYAVAFGLVPVFVWLSLPGEPLPPWWLVTAGALLGLGGHGANTLPDLVARQGDRRQRAAAALGRSTHRRAVCGVPHRRRVRARARPERPAWPARLVGARGDVAALHRGTPGGCVGRPAFDVRLHGGGSDRGGVVRGPREVRRPSPPVGCRPLVITKENAVKPVQRIGIAAAALVLVGGRECLRRRPGMRTRRSGTTRPTASTPTQAPSTSAT